jgi:hypothetical protein
MEKDEKRKQKSEGVKNGRGEGAVRLLGPQK